MLLLSLLLLVLVVFSLMYAGQGFWSWVVGGAGLLALWAGSGASLALMIVAGVLLAAVAILTGVAPLRQSLITPAVMRLIGSILPKIGETERIALDAGTVWFDGDLFSGSPDYKKLMDFKITPLTVKEQSFVDNEVEQLCSMVDPWKLEQERDLPPVVWNFMREKGFFGMIIPEEYGGHGFSAIAHSAVITKLASRDLTATVTAMVPNSLGPAELLLHYGTEEQKNHYLPRLARGEEMPCFALTGPEAGSDAAATTSVGIICEGEYEGKKVLGMRLNWCKRYITLAPVATLVGLAFRLKDPDHLLGEKEDLGITCALIPAHLEGVDIGRRHDPLGIPFLNGPTTGKDVFVPLDCIIGGKERAGDGWLMLMQCLAAGRGISLPASSCGGAQTAARVVGAYATVREQFDNPIGKFEGIEEPLARIGGLTYLMNAAREMTCGALDEGHKPSVISAIMKAYMTESMRVIVNDAMDIRAGSAICKGPRNILARAYVASPIGITVEGANILTRTLIIYGQGAIRCHPFVQQEMAAAASRDVAAFDQAFFGHVNFVFRNLARSFLLALTGGRLASVPTRNRYSRYYLGQLTRMSAAFSLVSDVVMGTIGGGLKRREKITGRLADALAWLYLGSATIKRFHDEGEPHEDVQFMRWGCENSIYEIQQALQGVLDNMPFRPAAWMLRPLIFPLGYNMREPDDALGADVARAILEDREGRLRLTRDIYVPPAEEPGLGMLEAALDRCVEGLQAEKKIRVAIRAQKLDRHPAATLVERAVAAGVITDDEKKRIDEADSARDEAIQVDDFKPGQIGFPLHPGGMVKADAKSNGKPAKSAKRSKSKSKAKMPPQGKKQTKKVLDGVA